MDDLCPVVVLLGSDGTAAHRLSLAEVLTMWDHARAVMPAAMAGHPEAVAVVQAAAVSADDPDLPPEERGRSIVGACLLHRAMIEQAGG